MRTPRLLYRILLAALCAFALGVIVVSAQDEPPTDDPTGGGLDPITTPAPLPTRIPRSAPEQVIRQDGVTVEVFFDTLPQGKTGLVHIHGANLSGSPVIGARARFLDTLTDFYPMPDESAEEGVWGLLSASMEQTTRTQGYDLALFVSFADGTRISVNTTIPVTLGGFITQIVTVPPDRAALLDIETERNELSRLESLFAPITLERYWDETGWQMPIASSLTSQFGAFRTFNNTLNTRHTGWDIRSTLGQPVLASAAGRVVYAGSLEIRGNYVLIDHGYGIYSGYAHLGTSHVTRGQDVAKDQVLGTVGDTGRVSGPHFHWEMAVNGNWVDSVQFIQLWMP